MSLLLKKGAKEVSDTLGFDQDLRRDGGEMKEGVAARCVPI